MKTETRAFYAVAVERAVAHITRALDEALDLEALARLAALSPFHFHRVFRGMLGETPLEMHRRLRLERAAQQLLHSDHPITRIAFDAGYDTHEAFTRSFRQAYAAAPSAFRKRALHAARPLQTELAARSGVHFQTDSTATPRIHPNPGAPMMDVRIEDKPELRVATVSHTGPYNQVADACARLGALVDRSGLLAFPEAALIVLHYDDPESTPAEQLRADAGLVVPPGVPLPDGLAEKHLPAGRYARATHLGPYSTLGDTWARFMGEWLPSSGQRVGEGSSYELYVNTPMTAAPHELRTDLYLPLA